MPATYKILVTAAVLAIAVISAPPSSARPLGPSTGTARPAPNFDHCFHGFALTGFKGPDAWFCGYPKGCIYVGDNWNDFIRSARTESNTTVELWDNAGCTGGAIVIDKSGYSEIGRWVSAYRVLS